MEMATAMGIALIISIILSTIFFFIVLVKLFKNEGALKGILGFFCGIYTFIWGWMKHKQLGMTKLMAIWSILMLAGMVMIPVMGVSSALMLPKYLQEMSGNLGLKFDKSDLSKKIRAIKPKRKNKKTKAPMTAAANKKSVADRRSSGNVAWSQKAMALWTGDRYKDPNAAVNYWSRAISGKQNTAPAYNNRGLAYYELKQYKEAVADYTQAIKLDPAYAAAYNNRGNSYYELHEYQMALRDFNQSIRLMPNYSKAYSNRALAHYQLDNRTAACSDFQKSCDQGDCEGIKWAMRNGICR
jgi:tetratricopeptide (TPR) repeat protein